MNNVFVGIDVAKDTVEVAERPGGEHKAFINDDEGLEAMVKWIMSFVITARCPNSLQCLCAPIL